VPPSFRRGDEAVRAEVTEAALDKLGARGISAVEAEQVPRNRHVTVRDPRQDSPRRRLLIGRTDGGRVLTLVIEQIADPTKWLFVTGWCARGGA
jgi:hypothetical protein